MQAAVSKLLFAKVLSCNNDLDIGMRIDCSKLSPQLGLKMAEMAHSTQPEFWSPPSPKLQDDMAVHASASSMAEACPRCGTEYLLGSHFCHSCGGRRPEAASPDLPADPSALSTLWEQTVRLARTTASSVSLDRVAAPSWLRYLSFHEIKTWIGLSTASFVAFLIGLGCVVGALLVGFLNAKTLVDWQAIQYYRAEWLLASTAAFVAGILLKRESPKDGR
jgi:hypothetical protein